METKLIKDKNLRGVRNSNIELFRIISMLMIVAHHYLVNSGLLDCIDVQSSLHFQDYFYYYLDGQEKQVLIASF